MSYRIFVIPRIIIILLLCINCSCDKRADILREYDGVDLAHPTIQDVPKLIEGLKNNDLYIRASVTHALKRLGPEAKEAIPALIQTLSDEELNDLASLALGKIGEEAVPELANALESKDPIVRWGAIRALRDIGAPAAQALPKLKELAATDSRKSYDGTYPNREIAEQAIIAIEAALAEQ